MLQHLHPYMTAGKVIALTIQTLSAKCCLCFFNFCEEFIKRNARLDESQAGIKIDGRYIDNLRYADDTTLMAESEEEIKRLLMKVKEESEKTD